MSFRGSLHHKKVNTNWLRGRLKGDSIQNCSFENESVHSNTATQAKDKTESTSLFDASILNRSCTRRSSQRIKWHEKPYTSRRWHTEILIITRKLGGAQSFITSHPQFPQKPVVQLRRDGDLEVISSTDIWYATDQRRSRMKIENCRRKSILVSARLTVTSLYNNYRLNIKCNVSTRNPKHNFNKVEKIEKKSFLTK